MTFKAILFDLDNTLIDFVKMKKLCCEAAMDAMIDAGLNIEKRKGLKTLYNLFNTHGWENRNIFQHFLLEVKGKVDVRILSYAVVAYRKVKLGLLSPYPKVKSTLIKLKEKNLKLGIISDAPELKVWTRLVSMNIDDFFDIVIATNKIGTKPFKSVLKQLKLKPEQVLMVGDNIERDIKAAKKDKIKTCFAKYGYIGKRTNIEADYTINSIEELLDII